MLRAPPWPHSSPSPGCPASARLWEVGQALQVRQPRAPVQPSECVFAQQRGARGGGNAAARLQRAVCEGVQGRALEHSCCRQMSGLCTRTQQRTLRQARSTAQIQRCLAARAGAQRRSRLAHKALRHRRQARPGDSAGGSGSTAAGSACRRPLPRQVMRHDQRRHTAASSRAARRRCRGRHRSCHGCAQVVSRGTAVHVLGHGASQGGDVRVQKGVGGAVPGGHVACLLGGKRRSEGNC